MPPTDVDDHKNAIRSKMWSLLDEHHVVLDGTAHGSIPNFLGAEVAARRLADLDVWHAADVVKAVPDTAQQPVRALALQQGKTVYMAVPKLAKEHPFYLLDPAQLPAPADQAADRHVAATLGQPVGIADMAPVDLVICGSVIVNRHGARLGKGAGYSDLEIAFLHDAGLIDATTPIVTTVHPLQVVDHELPETDHDFRIDLIVTPDEVIAVHQPRRPTGLIWDHLSPDKIATIPVLAAEARRRIYQSTRK